MSREQLALDKFDLQPYSSSLSDLRCFGLAMLFYGLYAAACFDLIPIMWFVVLGSTVIMRHFNNMHQSFHGQVRSPLLTALCRIFVIIVGPFQLGFAHFRTNHLNHHRFQGQANDPELYLQRGGVLSAVWNALTQPEQSAWRYGRENGWSTSVVGSLICYGLIFVLLGFQTKYGLYYIATTRVTNALFFLISDYFVHQERQFQPGSLSFPKIAEFLWVGLYGKESWNGMTHHHLHHRFPVVHDRNLPEVLGKLQPGFSA